MAGKTIDMSKLRKVIKLYAGGKSKVFISTYLGLSRNTVTMAVFSVKYLRFDVQIDENEKTFTSNFFGIGMHTH